MVKIMLGLQWREPKHQLSPVALLRHPNSAQDTERAVDQTAKSKSHSKTKDKDGPKSTSSRVERTRPENSLTYGKRPKEKYVRFDAVS